MEAHPPEALIGQLVMVDFPGTTPPADLRRLIAERSLGGIILFQKNVASAAQTASLCFDLQEVARRAGRPPLLIAIDQEGGPVERVPLGVPGAMALGATQAPAYAEKAGRLAGRVLRAVGANVDFAPVLDVNTNPLNPVIGIRSFGEEPEAVGRMGLAFAAGLHAEGVIATGKHFPGHGDTVVDSHHDLPVVAHALDRLEAVEFLPFREAIRGGLPAVMTAHIAFTVAGMVPATLSPVLLDGTLRRRLGFTGVIFTDSLAMSPIKNRIGVGRAAVQAILAGADVLLALGGGDVSAEVLAALQQAVERGEVTRERLQQSVQRLQRLRARIGPADPVGEAGRVVAAEELQSPIREIAEHAVTLVRHAPGRVPLVGTETVRVVALAAGEGPPPALGVMRRAWGRPGEDVLLSPTDPADSVLAAEGIVVLLTCSRGRPSDRQVDIVRRAQAVLGDSLIVIATGTPYDLAEFPSVSTYVATYGQEPALLEAAARILTGQIPPRGRLPVSIPGHYSVGHGTVW